ncbi:MAG: glutaminase A [Bacilli bacterium]|nr:glutaminase A [Bacilli bacterium]
MKNIQNTIDKVYYECLELKQKGEVASYIPELAKVDPNLFGAALITSNGTIYGIGDYQKKFSMQSVSKVCILIQAILDSGHEKVFKKVNIEPTSSSFNSIANLELKEDNKPLNPFINAGAIVCTSFIKGDTSEEKVQRIISLIKNITGNDDITYDKNVYQSEASTGSRNKSLAYYMNSTGVLEGDIEVILDAYFKICSIEVTCEDLAKIALSIAHNGMNLNGFSIFSSIVAKELRAIMCLCGMYDGSGEFALRVGLPSKSGVGGGIMSVSLDNDGMGIGVFGPSLDSKGNSYLGIAFLEKLTTELGISLFE